MTQPTLIERFADNGEHSHWELVNSETGKIVWSEAATPPPQGLAWVKAKAGDKFDSRSVVRFIHTKFAIQDAAGFIKRFPHRIDTLEYLVESAPAPQTDASQLREELEGAKKDNEAFKREFTEAMDDVARLGGENEKLQKEIERVKLILKNCVSCGYYSNWETFKSNHNL